MTKEHTHFFRTREAAVGESGLRQCVFRFPSVGDESRGGPLTDLRSESLFGFNLGGNTEFFVPLCGGDSFLF